MHGLSPRIGSETVECNVSEHKCEMRHSGQVAW